MGLMKNQDNASVQRGLPVDIVNDAKQVVAITGETVQLYYYNSNVLTADAGQPAGTVVVGKLANSGILNALNDVIGTYKDTSLSFTSTALTTEMLFPFVTAEQSDEGTSAGKAAAITAGLTNGQYCVDYRTGTIYGVKASTQTTLTATAYAVMSTIQSAGGLAANVKIVDSTNPANQATVITGGTNENSLLTAGGNKEVAFTTTTAQSVASTDAANYRGVSVHIVQQGTGSSVSFQESNDNLNWAPVALARVDQASGGFLGNFYTAATVSGVIFAGTLSARYFRLNVTGITAGTTSGVIEFSAQPNLHSMLMVGATQNSTWSVQPIPGTSQGWSVNSQTALSTTVVPVKASAGNLGGYSFYNPNASVSYIQLFNIAQGSVVLGTTTPTYVIPIPATSAVNIEITNGLSHSVAISAAATTTPTGLTAPGTGLVGFFLFK
jgi:hypothetical protein